MINSKTRLKSSPKLLAPQAGRNSEGLTEHWMLLVLVTSRSEYLAKLIVYSTLHALSLPSQLSVSGRNTCLSKHNSLFKLLMNMECNYLDSNCHHDTESDFECLHKFIIMTGPSFIKYY